MLRTIVSICAVALPIAFHRDFFDVNSCRTFTVDLDMGKINTFCCFGNGPDSHIIRVENKKIVYLHTLTACGDVAGKCFGFK